MAYGLTAIILAAGKGTRIRSRRTKVLHRVCGRPILSYALRAVKGIAPDQILIVVNNCADEAWAELGSELVELVEQKEQLGTGHAVLQAKGRAHGETILIVPGDLPSLSTAVLQGLLTRHVAHEAELSVLTMVLEEPEAYGRLLRDGNKRPIKIVEACDATPEELEIDEVNTGIYCVQNDDFLWESLASLNTINARGEYHLTDLVDRYRVAGKHVLAVEVEDSQRVMGINSRAELAVADRLMRLQKLEELMAAGVTIVDPTRTYIESEVTIGADTIILPGTNLHGDSTVGENCTLGPDTWIDNSSVEEGCRVWYSVVERARIRAGTTVGPYAHLRPGADVGPDARIGNFVEVKAARVKRGAKVGHHAYIGDAEVGEGVNIGAGTITCNYDGERKHRTTIGDRAFIGSNTSLVAPVTIGEGAIIGAGSVITQDVPPGALALGRARQVNKQHKKEKKNDR